MVPLLAAVALLLPWLPAATAPQSEPYVEIVPDRYTFRGGPQVYGWGTVPAECCVVQILSLATTPLLDGHDDGAVLLTLDSGGIMLARSAAGRRVFSHVAVTSALPAGSRLTVSGSSATPSSSLTVGAATPTGLSELHCELAEPDAKCVVVAAVHALFGEVVSARAAGNVTFVAAANGLFRCAGGHCTHLLESAMTALAVHEATDVVAAGSRDKVWLFRIDGAMIRWEWCTAIDGPDAGSGGVVDGPVTALEFDEPSGDLYAGNDIALNIRAAASGAWSRVSGDMGLPMANITSLAATHDPVSGAAQRWVGTARGVAVWSSDKDQDPPWRYLYGPRWHPVQ